MNEASTPQPRRERQVRVFISSTFRDMHAERDHLVTVVFPELRERVELLGLEFFDVDLRWGVPEKGADGEQANSWEYCRQWIDRVEPFFVCMLGQRYGWVPGPEKLKDAADRERQTQQPRSITDLEVRHAVLYSQRKRRSYFYLRQAEAPATASDYVDPPLLLEKLDQLKTEVRACGRPVWDYPCEWTGNGFTGMEEFGRRVLDDLWSGVLRDERYVGKDVWRQVLGTDPDTDERYTDESQPVPPDLAAKIVALAQPAPKYPHDAEREQMETFAASRLRWFQGRTKELRQLAEFIHSTDANASRLAVVAAAPGQGKSALMAKLHSTLSSQPSTLLITHFVGATGQSSNAWSLVKRLLDELDRSGIPSPETAQGEGNPKDEPKQDFNSLCLRLAERLGDYAGERRIVLLLDALNQLSDGHELGWLPHRLGPSVRVVVSCVDEPRSSRREEAPSEKAESRTPNAEIDQSLLTSAATENENEQRVLRALYTRRPAPLRVPFGGLDEGDVRAIVTDYLHEYFKELDPPHVDAICAMPQARNPLYLLVLLGELRTLGGNDMNRVVPALISSLPQEHPTTVSLFRWVLQRLEVFGPEAVRWWCLYLAMGRVGMASPELAELLARKLGVDAAATGLRIERGLRRYLQPRGPQLDFFHAQLRHAVLDRYGARADAANGHQEMADYFTACAKGTDPQKEWETDSVRGFAECVFHLVKAGHHDLGAGLLSNFQFTFHKTRVGLLEGVFDDYDILSHEASSEVTEQIAIWSAFFREKAHILRRGDQNWSAHKILLQLAVEHADDSPLALGAEAWLAEGRCDWIWLRRAGGRPTHIEPNPCIRTFEGHRGSVLGARMLESGRIVSWGYDGTLRIWDGQSGAALLTLEGHGKEVLGAQIVPDGRLVSWSADGTVRLWDVQNGTLLHTVKGPTAEIVGAQFRGDGRILSWSGDKTMQLWNWQTSALISTFEGHTEAVSDAKLMDDGRILSWSRLTEDRTLRLWDSKSGSLLLSVEAHKTGPWGAQVLPDGRILSWGKDATLRLWDGQNGRALQTIYLHTPEGWRYGWMALGVAVLEDRRILTWSDDSKLRFWDSQSGELLRIFGEATEAFDGAVLLGDGRILSWSVDGRMHLWDEHSGALLGEFCGHTDQVNGVQILADNRMLSWSADSTVRLWQMNYFLAHRGLGGHTRPVYGAKVLKDGRILSWSMDNTMRLWDRQSGAMLTTLDGHSHFKGPLFIGGKILSWSDASLRLWDAESGNLIRVLEGHTDTIRGVCVFATNRILSWSEDRTLRIWDEPTGDLLHILKGHSDMVLGAEALRDGRILSWSLRNEVRLWEATSGLCVGTLNEFKENVDAAVALPDGRIALQTTSRSDPLWVWNSEMGGKVESISRAELQMAEPDLDNLLVRDTYSSGSASCGIYYASEEGFYLSLSREKDPGSKRWHAGCQCWAEAVLLDGTIVVVLDDHQVCLLHLHSGCGRIALADWKCTARIPQHVEAKFVEGQEASFTHRVLIQPSPPLEVRFKMRMIPSDKNRICCVVDGTDENMLFEVSKVRRHARSEAVSKVTTFQPHAAFIPSPPTTAPREATVAERRAAAVRCFQKGFWEVASDDLQKLLDSGEPLAEFGPKLVICLLNAHETPLETDLRRIQTLLQALDEAGHTNLAAPLRQQLQAKLFGTHKLWWKFW